MRNYKYLLVLLIALSESVSAQHTVQQNKYLTYDNDGFVATEKTILSNKDTQTIHYTYPDDLNAMGGPACFPPPETTLGLREVINENKINEPVETYTVISKYSTGDQLVTKGEVHTYNHNGYPYEVYKLETAVPLTSFTPYYYSPSSCNLFMDSHYTLQETNTVFDNFGNPLETVYKGNKTVSRIFSYKNAYEIAEVENASNSEIAYTSFETPDKGFWNYSGAGVTSPIIMGSCVILPIAGNKLFSFGDNHITRNELPLGDYIVSFWLNHFGPSCAIGSVNVNATNTSSLPVTTRIDTGATAQGWTYYEYHITNVTDVDISGSGYIDEIRLYPNHSEMKSNAYKPLVGPIYSDDVSGHITLYEYDDLNRLIYIRDEDKNIKKKYDYRLQQPE